MKPSSHFASAAFAAQYGQDRWIYDNVLSHADVPHTFVEFGARDGKQNSNSFFFETQLGWEGVLFEAGVDDVPQLRKNRRCTFAGRPGACIHGAVSSTESALMQHAAKCLRGGCRIPAVVSGGC